MYSVCLYSHTILKIGIVIEALTVQELKPEVMLLTMQFFVPSIC